MNHFLLLITMLSMLAACAKAPLTMHESAKADFEKARTMVDDGAYDEADVFLERFINRYPYSDYASSAELLRIYATYKGDRLELTQVLAERFKKRHPRHPDLAYAQYMLAMSWYQQRAEPDREQAPTLEARKAFEELIRDFPASPYAAEAKTRLQQLNNLLAAHELNVGQFYFEKHRFVAAVNRFQNVLQHYQNSPAIEQALYYLAASYDALKMKKQAHDVALLLGHNYPKGEWSQKAQGWL